MHGTGLSRTPLRGSSTLEESVHTAGRLSLPRLPGADTGTRPAAQEDSVGSRPRALGLAVRGEPGFIFWDIPSSLPPSSGEELSNVAPTSEVFLTWIRSKASKSYGGGGERRAMRKLMDTVQAINTSCSPWQRVTSSDRGLILLQPHLHSPDAAAAPRPYSVNSKASKIQAGG